jgi:hypothetical protein
VGEAKEALWQKKGKGPMAKKNVVVITFLMHFLLG